MILSDANLAFRKHPVIKICLSRSAEKPNNKVVLSALHEIMAQYPVLGEFMSDNHYTSHYLEPEFIARVSDQWWLSDGVAQSVSYMAQELSRSVRGVLSASTKNRLIDWVHASGHMTSMGSDVLTELKWCQGIHPEQPLKLYRGLLFSKWQFSEQHHADNPKLAKIFLDAIKHGHTSLMLDYSRLSSWTIHKHVADNFARRSAAFGSEHAATMNWLRKGNKFIDKELGLIISATINPEDIICDVSKIDLGHLLHGDEGEFLVRPGAHLQVSIEHIYLPTGEVTSNQMPEFLNHIMGLAT